MKTKIKMNNAEDVRKFVAIASNCDFDIDVQYHHFFLDGKSLIGLMSIDLSNIMTIYYNDSNPVFEMMLKEYEIS